MSTDCAPAPQQENAGARKAVCVSSFLPRVKTLATFLPLRSYLPDTEVCDTLFWSDE